MQPRTLSTIASAVTQMGVVLASERRRREVLCRRRRTDGIRRASVTVERVGDRTRDRFADRSIADERPNLGGCRR